MPEQIVDPVSGFSIPSPWIRQCPDAQAREKIRSGRWVLLCNGQLLRRGLTTGTTAAAACKGAVISLCRTVDSVQVATPVGLRVSVPVVAKTGFCLTRKDGGDHQFDITSGAEIIASATPADELEFVAGKGIGRLASTGDSQGRAAMSPSAQRQILNAIREGLAETDLIGAKIELCVPRGEELAQKTLNPRLGIVGGISILGSTGFVEPWNEHLTESRTEELKGAKKVVVTTGRTGLKFSRVLFPDHLAVLMGNHLDLLKFEKDQQSIICGLPALILKWAWPEVLKGTGYGTVAELVEREPDHGNIALALQRARELLPDTRIVLLRKDGSIFQDRP